MNTYTVVTSHTEGRDHIIERWRVEATDVLTARSEGRHRHTIKHGVKKNYVSVMSAKVERQRQA